MQSAWAPLVVFALLAGCAGLFYGGRAVGRRRGAPPWARGVDRYRMAFAALLGAAVLTLLTLGVLAVVALVHA